MRQCESGGPGNVLIAAIRAGQHLSVRRLSQWRVRMVGVDASLRIETFVADLDQTVAFYERLGFETTGRSEGPPRYAAFRLGQARVGAAEAAAIDPALRAVPTGTEIVIEVDDLHGVRDRILGAGLTLQADLEHRQWGLEDFRLKDPDGYYYRFTSRR